MDGDRETSERLGRIERKLDRLLQFCIVLLVCQPVLLFGLLMPGLVPLLVCYALLALLVALAIFPNLETKLPSVMRWLGNAFGRLRRRMRAFAMR